MTNRLGLEVCNNAAQNNDGYCLAKEYTGVYTKMPWKCKLAEHKIWLASLHQIKNGKSWCPECGKISSNKKRKLKNGLDQAIKIAAERNGKCLSAEYTNNKTKLLLKCHVEEHSEWQAHLTNMRLGKWCPECSVILTANALRLKDGLEQAISIAEERKGRCLSNEYKNFGVKLQWRCEKKHIWFASLRDIKCGKHWCPKCKAEKLSQINRLSNGLEIARQIAKERNGECLSVKYISIAKNMTWKCGIDNNIWEATLANIRKGSWCPKCKGSKNQKKIYAILSSMFPNYTIYYNYRKFGWLKNIKKLEIDVFVKDIKLAIEYDGKQHYKPIEYFGGKSGYERIKRLDLLKNSLIKKHPEDIKHFIRFNYKQDISYNFIEREVGGILSFNNK